MRSWLPIAAVMILAVIAGAASASPSFSVALRTFFHDWEPVFVGMGTIALAAFTWRLWLSTDLLWEHTRVVERAYIKLAHSKALEHDGQGSFSVMMQARNTGRTPATVTDVVVKPLLLSNAMSLPSNPDYKRSGGEPRGAFLVVNTHMNFTETFRMPQPFVAQIEDGRLRLYLLGYVDYIDVFGIRHRAGYARLYEPSVELGKNNLSFIPERTYNYDRPRARGEGNDWDGH
jgi:hypothetical protein